MMAPFFLACIAPMETEFMMQPVVKAGQGLDRKFSVAPMMDRTY